MSDSININAVIFDCDGVIIDYEPVLVEMTLETLEHYGIKLTKAKYLKELYPKLAGNNTQMVLNTINKTYKKNITFEEFMNYRKDLRHKYFPRIVLMPHIKELVSYFKKQKLKIGLATSSDRYKLAYLKEKFPDLMKMFDVMYSAEDVVNGKPDPEIFLKTAKQLGVKPKDTLVIEDSLNGLVAAKRGNFECIILKNSYLKKKQYYISDKIKPLAIVNDLIKIKQIL